MQAYENVRKYADYDWFQDFVLNIRMLEGTYVNTVTDGNARVESTPLTRLVAILSTVT